MSAQPESAAVALIKAAMWPLVVLTGLALFYSPMHKTLDSLAKRSDSIQTIKLGTLELDIKASDLPSPDPDAVKAMEQLDQSMILEFLPIDENLGSPKCYYALVDPRLSTDTKLSQLGLVKFTEEAPESGSQCQFPHHIEFTPLGLKARNFLLKVIAIEISGKNSN